MIIDKRAHQGDVYLKSCELPVDIAIVESKNGKTILAYGEKTGHHHRFESPNVKLFTAKIDGKTYVLISDYPAELKHEEHESIKFAPGAYEVLIARQWTDENEPIAVID